MPGYQTFPLAGPMSYGPAPAPPPPPDPMMQQRQTAQMQEGMQARADVRRAQIEAGLNAQRQAFASEEQRRQMAHQAYMANLGATNQAALAQHQAQLGEVEDYRRAQIAQDQAAHSANLQAQLSEIQLGQQEEARMTRLRQARSAIMADPNLAPEERQMLVTQIMSGLNPLENRARQAQMLQTQVQTAAQYQQAQQSALLFNQHQEWLSRGIEGQLQTVTDPQTGRQQLFHVDAQGQIRALDFSHAQALQEMQMANIGTNIYRQAQMMPGELQLQTLQIAHAGLSNTQLSQQIQHLDQMNPLQRDALAQEIQNRRQSLLSAQQDYRHREMRFPLQLEQDLAHLDAAWQTIEHHRVMNPLQQQMLQGQIQQQPLHQQYLQGQVNQQPLQLDLMRAQIANQQALGNLHNQQSQRILTPGGQVMTDNQYLMRRAQIVAPALNALPRSATQEQRDTAAAAAMQAAGLPVNLQAFQAHQASAGQNNNAPLPPPYHPTDRGGAFGYQAPTQQQLETEAPYNHIEQVIQTHVAPTGISAQDWSDMGEAAARNRYELRRYGSEEGIRRNGGPQAYQRFIHNRNLLRRIPRRMLTNPPAWHGAAVQNPPPNQQVANPQQGGGGNLAQINAARQELGLPPLLALPGPQAQGNRWQNHEAGLGGFFMR